ncbi:MAG: DegT/DnrJ/EryC1/StrS family aminotransferase [bacterium]|jgi:dTDP-4-amino-4,6-dideoxygalactose transaminase
MTVPLLDLRAQYESIRGEIDAAIAAVIESQRFILGPVVERFEAEVAEYLGVPHAVACASGTDALLLVLKALDLEPGDEVIVPAFTFFASAGAIWNAGLRPVFADIDPATFNVDPASVRAAITDRTRAIVVVHLFGQMADMPALEAIAREYGLALIEDAAQAFGARQRQGEVWRMAGTVGTAGCFSFFPSKNLGAFGDGGMVVTRDAALAERVRMLRTHGGREMYHHEFVGTNSRLDALQAAVLSAKLPHLRRWSEGRRANAAAYDADFADVAEVITPTVLEVNEPIFNQYTLRVQDRDGLKAHLDAQGIGNAIYYPVALHLQPCFATLGYRPGDLVESERATREVLSLPVFAELTAEQRSRVVEAVRGYYGRSQT